MDKTNGTTVEAKDQTAVSEQAPVKSELELQIEKLNADLGKVSAERDNYRKGMLKAKGKPAGDTEDASDDEDIETKVARAVRATLLEKEESDLLKQKEALLTQAGARISELETAIKNRSQISVSGGAGASSEPKFTAKDPVLSDEKIQFFKSQGKDDAWIERFKKNRMNVR